MSEISAHPQSYFIWRCPMCRVQQLSSDSGSCHGTTAHPGCGREMTPERVEVRERTARRESGREVTVEDVERSLIPARARLRRHRWKCETGHALGLGDWEHVARGLRIRHTIMREGDGQLWEHLSISRADGVMPGWEQTRDVFHEVCGEEALGVIVVAPGSEHFSIAEVSHVWRCLTRRPLPDFTRGLGVI